MGQIEKRVSRLEQEVAAIVATSDDGGRARRRVLELWQRLPAEVQAERLERIARGEVASVSPARLARLIEEVSR